MAAGLGQPNIRDQQSLRVSASKIFLRQIIWFAAAALLVSGARPAAALEPTTSLKNYGRQAWAMENGLPQNTVQALAQTKDGFLWLGTEAGLVRFDGVEFQTYDRNSNSGLPGPALPGNDIRCLLATADGALWIGTNAGLARWKDGTAKTIHGAGWAAVGRIFCALRQGNRGFAIAVSTEMAAVLERETDSRPVG